MLEGSHDGGGRDDAAVVSFFHIRPVNGAGDDQSRLVQRRAADEDARVGVGFVAAAVSFGDLGGAGLAEECVLRTVGLAAGAFGDDLPHHIPGDLRGAGREHPLHHGERTGIIRILGRDRRADQVAAVGEHRESPAKLERRHGDFLPHRHAGGAEARVPFLQRVDHAARLAGEAGVGQFAEAEGLDRVVEFRVAHPVADDGHAPVAGFDEHL